VNGQGNVIFSSKSQVRTEGQVPIHDMASRYAVKPMGENRYFDVIYYT
jgi:hypothetical protein